MNLCSIYHLHAYVYFQHKHIYTIALPLLAIKKSGAPSPAPAITMGRAPFSPFNILGACVPLALPSQKVDCFENG